jgi:hypothetical protein
MVANHEGVETGSILPEKSVIRVGGGAPPVLD